MSTQAERIVRIEHPDGRRYAVTEAAYKRTKLMIDGKEQTYQDAGFAITFYEDGSEYKEGAEPSSFAINIAGRSPEIGVVEEASKKRTRSAATDTSAATDDNSDGLADVDTGSSVASAPVAVDMATPSNEAETAAI